MQLLMLITGLNCQDMIKAVFSLILLFVCSTAFGVEPAALKRVIDGDTIAVYYRGREERVRLTGIDAPELHYNDKAAKDAARSKQGLQTILLNGKRSYLFLKSQLRNQKKLNLEFDIGKRDKYGRLLAYVYLPDGTMLNEEMVRAGYASLMTIPPNVKYSARLKAAYRHALSTGAGLWAKDR